ncbi:MAG: pyridoxamine 5'-phosphate oxidase family protein, partial [Methylocystis sp.]|nr:pyridoxamine 5'-phosphate oxidase family protein [Methylocystis sp.]
MTTNLPREPAATPPRDPRQDADFDPAAEAKLLLRTVRAGALATLSESGAPFASLTSVATLHDGRPILITSRLAVHTGNLERDPRCSLLLAQGGRGDPLAHPRLTLIATAARTNDPVAPARFLRRHPKASLYAGFADFSFWRLEVTGGRLNGGFGRAADLGPEFLLTPLKGAEALIADETAVLAQLNRDGADTLGALASKLAGEANGAWRASGLDP